MCYTPRRRKSLRQPQLRRRWMFVVGDQTILRGVCSVIVWALCSVWWMERSSIEYLGNINDRWDARSQSILFATAFRRTRTSTREKLKEEPQKQPVIDESLIRLQALGVNVSSLSPETIRRIPSWSTIQSQYYEYSDIRPSSSALPEPVFVGLSDCAAYRARVPLLDRVVAPAGLFHSGTNLLVQLLQANCPRMSINQSSHYGTIRNHVNGLAWQVSWGKHNPAWARNQGYHIDHDIYRNTPVHVQLPVVLIRHPYDWMERMCSWSYSVYFPKTTRPNQLNSQCPWLIYEGQVDTEQGWVPVLAKWGVGDRVYQSLVHLWNEWYQQYFYQSKSTSASTSTTTTSAETSYPRLMVRLEDLIFIPELVISKICHCVGGVYIPESSHGRPFVSMLSNAKSNDAGHAATSVATANLSMMGLVDAWIEYGHIRNYTNLTYRHLIPTVMDPKLLQTFQYQL